MTENAPAPAWRKSTFSESGNCVEVAAAPDGGVLFRDSKNPAAPVLAFTAAEWEAFLDGAKKNEFDELA